MGKSKCAKSPISYLTTAPPEFESFKLLLMAVALPYTTEGASISFKISIFLTYGWPQNMRWPLFGFFCQKLTIYDQKGPFIRCRTQKRAIHKLQSTFFAFLHLWMVPERQNGHPKGGKRKKRPFTRCRTQRGAIHKLQSVFFAFFRLWMAPERHKGHP